LRDDGHMVHTQVEELTEDTQIVIGAVPLREKTEEIEKLFSQIKGKTFIAGSINTDVYDIAKKNDIKIIDVLEDEEVVTLNTIPTAEGALQVAMEESDITLHGSNCLVIGYGRIGKVLSKMLLRNRCECVHSGKERRRFSSDRSNADITK